MKVKIDDGTFFGGEDLVEWLCSRLRQEVAFGAAVCKELEEERLASGIEFDRCMHPLHGTVQKKDNLSPLPRSTPWSISKGLLLLPK